MNSFAPELVAVDNVVGGIPLAVACVEGEDSANDANHAPEPKHASFMRRLGQTVLGLGLVAAPIGAGLAAIETVPPPQVNDIGVDGLNSTVDLQLGSNTISLSTGEMGAQRASNISILGKHIGVGLRTDALNVPLLTPTGSFNQNTIETAGHVFADKGTLDAELSRVKQQVVTYYETAGFGAAYISAMLEVFGYMYIKHRRKALAELNDDERQLVHSDRSVERVLGTSVAAAAILAQLAVLGTVAFQPNHDQAVKPTAELAGTSFDGWQLMGPFTPFITSAIQGADAYSEQEKAFYDLASINQLAALQKAFGTTGTSLAKDPDILTIEISDDYQGTSGMTRLVGEAAQFFNADAVMNLGDLTTTGSSQESLLSYVNSYTVSSLAHNSKNIPVITSLGRHDTPAVVSYADKVKITVADGKIQKVGDIPNVMGFNSPYIVNFGQASKLIDPKVTEDVASEKLEEQACADKPAIVFGHDAEDFGPLIASGCVPIVIGGHNYTAKPGQNVITTGGTDTEERRITRVLSLGSTGGHSALDALGGPTIPRNIASHEALQINKKTGAVSNITINVTPAGFVNVQITQLDALSPAELARFN